MNTKNTNLKLIVGFTALLVLVAAIIFIRNHSKKDAQTASQSGSIDQVSFQTVGDISATIKADIELREIDFSMSKKDVQKKEEKLDDTLNTPNSVSGTDGYVYITYPSNPDNPLSLFNITADTEGKMTTGITYVFVNDALTEVRFQFGAISDESTQSLINQFCSQYGQYTYSNSHDSSATYNWKTEDSLLTLSREVLMTEFDDNNNVKSETYGTTVFFRK
ncbi:MAG: hypothetical protein IKN54_06705 [Lachnospiraceae bacterium]|nr:hypothetical protein [Lachnospiraceae bacterium]